MIYRMIGQKLLYILLKNEQIANLFTLYCYMKCNSIKDK